MDQLTRSFPDDTMPESIPGGHSLTTDERGKVDLSHLISGWGSDLDPAVRPGVPRDKAPELGVEAIYPDIPQQPETVRIHKSTEHPRMTPVFGTSCPPKGLSGLLRDTAYTWSEGKLQRWLMLLFADRVDVVEDVVSDVLRLRPPNLVREMGLKSEWQYNRNGAITKAAVASLAVAGLVVAMHGRRRRRRLTRA